MSAKRIPTAGALWTMEPSCLLTLNICLMSHVLVMFSRKGGGREGGKGRVKEGRKGRGEKGEDEGRKVGGRGEEEREGRGEGGRGGGREGEREGRREGERSKGALTVMGVGYLMYGLMETSLDMEKVERSDVTLALSSSLYDPPPLAPWEGREEGEGGRKGEGGRREGRGREGGEGGGGEGGRGESGEVSWVT